MERGIRKDHREYEENITRIIIEDIWSTMKLRKELGMDSNVLM